MDITVSKFLSYFGGNTKVILEDELYEHKVYWRGTIDQWFNKENLEFKNMIVCSATIPNDIDVLFVRIQN